MTRTTATILAYALGCAVVLQPQATGAAMLKEKILHSFNSGMDGQNPEAGMIDVNGIMYGTTYGGGNDSCQYFGCGTVFSIDTNTGSEKVLYAFCSKKNCTDGEWPAAGLIKMKDVLYGTTEYGGAYGYGAVFALDLKTGAERVVYSFGSPQNSADGKFPQDGLINVNDMLYGTTSEGGSHLYGTVFALDPRTGVETVLYSFCSQSDCADGGLPDASLIDVKGMLYGTTFWGGIDGEYGTVFELDPNTGIESVLHEFQYKSDGTEGYHPEAGLLDVKGILYGTTNTGGTTGGGIVFALDPNTGAETVLHSFDCGKDGCFPQSSLVVVKGWLYGTTRNGGSHDQGTVFALDPKTGAETVVYSFGSPLPSHTDGRFPLAGLIDMKGTLYGTTNGGGNDGCQNTGGCGTVFALKARPASATR